MRADLFRARFSAFILVFLPFAFLAFALAACAARPGEPDGLVSVPGSTVKVARIDAHTYAISLDGVRFSAPRTTTFRLHVKHASFDPLEESAPAMAARLAGGTTQLYLVQFITPPLEAYRAHLAQLGARTYDYFPSHAHLVRMAPGTAQVVAAQRYVRWVGPFRPSYRITPELLAIERPARVNVRLLDPEARTVVVDRVLKLGGRLHPGPAASPLLSATLDAQGLAELARLDEVVFIDAFSAPEPDLHVARELSGANYIESVAGYTGQGVRGEVMDGNVLETHRDFARTPLVFHGKRSGTAGHGTATSGIVFGDGTGNAKARGVLPGGQGIFASYNELTDRYAHTKELLQAPYFAVFQSNSWGGTLTTEYTNESAEFDRMLFDLDILVLQSQGNTATRQSRPEAWAKNVLSVGGFAHNHTLDPADDEWRNSASIGPAADGRTKPDLVHFFDAIRVTASSGGYDFFGGTSSSTPITAGYAGLFFQMWAEGVFGNAPLGATVFERRPHMTTSKAILINTASGYVFSGEDHDMRRVHQGWGRVDVKRLHGLRAKLYVVNETDLLAPLASTVHSVTVQAGEPELRATLVFADPPGTPAASRARVNDLTLRVVSPSGVEYFGNHGLRVGNWSQPGGTADAIDTVENVFVRAPEAGAWTVEVRADEINQDGHTETPEIDADYALAVSGVTAGAPTP